MYEQIMLTQRHMWCCSKCIPTDYLPAKLIKLEKIGDKVICPKCGTDWTADVDIDSFQGDGQ